MKRNDLTREEKEELEKFGANTWFVEYLHEQYQEGPNEVTEQWKIFFNGIDKRESSNGEKQETSKTSAKTGSNSVLGMAYPLIIKF